ncbi:MAG: efflux RND transporter periplasmic adaptor subunit [Acidobacteriota bacterium]
MRRRRDVTVLPAVIVLLAAVPACRRAPREATDAPSGTPAAAAESRAGEQGPRMARQNPRGREVPPGRGANRRILSGRPQAPVRLSPEQAEAIEIRVVEVGLRAMSARLEVMGKVLAPQTRKAIVTYAFPARIADVRVAIGDWVEQGQAVVTLQSEEVGEARSAFYKARADRELARASFERERRLFDRGVGAQKNLLAAEAELKVAEASMDAAEKKLHLLGFTEEQIQASDEVHDVNPIVSLFAPIAGRVIENNAVLGDMVDQSTEILTIMDPRILWVDAEIYERDIARVHPGQVVELSVPAYPGENFGGRLSYVGDVIKEDTRTVTVRTEVENRDQRLKPGMFADVQISLNGTRHALAVPEEAVLDDEQETIVFVAVDEGYLPRVVEVGGTCDGYVEVLRGLDQGDRVVSAGSFQLKSKLREEMSATNVH